MDSNLFQCKTLIFPPHIISTGIMVFRIIDFQKLNRIEINGNTDNRKRYHYYANDMRCVEIRFIG